MMRSCLREPNWLAAAIDGFLEFGSRNKFCDFLGGNFQRCSGLGIPTRSRLARADRKGTEANQCDFASFLQRRYNTVDRRIEGIACLDLRDLRILCDLVN